MNFKTIEEHPKHFILRHEDGHEVHIAKSALSKPILNKIKSFADGGQATNPSGPISQDTASDFMKGYNSQTTASAPKPKPKMAQGGSVNNPKLQQSTAQQEKPMRLAEGSSEPVPDPTIGLTPNDQTDYSQQASFLPRETSDQDQTSPSTFSETVDAIKNKASQAYDKVANSDVAKTLLTGQFNTDQPNQNVQQAALSQAQQSPQFQRVNLGEAQPAGGGIPLPNYGAQFAQAGQQMLGGIQQQANVQGQTGRQQAQAINQQIQQQQDFYNDAQNNMKSIQDEINNVKQDFSNEKINPNHIFQETGTLGKISTALGLILGGMGGGILRQGNPAMDFLNKQIDRDIEAQKANLGKKATLLEANLKQYGNLNQAVQVTNMQMHAIIDAQAQKIAAQNQGPMAQAMANQLSAKYQQEMLPQMSQLAIQQAGFKMLNQQGQQANPGLAIRFIVPEKEQSEAYKELNSLQAMQKGGENAVKAFDQIANMTLSGAFSPRQKHALIAPITAQLSKETAGRFTEQDAKYLESLWPSTGDLPETKSVKRQQLIKLLGEKMNSPLLQSYGIPIPRFGTGRQIQASPNFQQAGQQQQQVMMQPASVNQ